MHFLEKLDSITKKHDSIVCVGLDTDITKLPQVLRKDPNPMYAFNRSIVEATADIAQCYKLNLAFYESKGAEGYEALRRTLAVIPDEIVTIGDAKRGDIGNTSAMYARALFDDLGFDAVTVAPYMGSDSVQPFLDYQDRGTFILGLTSNKGSQDFQYLMSGDRPLYEHVASKIKSWNTAQNCGIVVGATHPEELGKIRELVGDMPILIPGLGAQGGDLEKTIENGVVRGENPRVICNSSRGIIYADDSPEFASAARKKAIEFRDALNAARNALQ